MEDAGRGRGTGGAGAGGLGSEAQSLKAHNEEVKDFIDIDTS